MARHGYLREFDEGYDRDEDRERNEDRRSRLRFEGEDRSGQGYGPEHGYGGFQGDYGGGFEQGGFGSRGDYARRRTSFTSHPDEHYRSWRDKQITAMDRDYEDYRREREQEFNKDFESWRRQRRSNPPPLQTGMTQTSTTTDPSGTLELTNETQFAPQDEPDSTATATLGTTSGGPRRR